MKNYEFEDTVRIDGGQDGGSEQGNDRTAENGYPETERNSAPAAAVNPEYGQNADAAQSGNPAPAGSGSGQGSAQQSVQESPQWSGAYVAGGQQNPYPPRNPEYTAYAQNSPYDRNAGPAQYSPYPQASANAYSPYGTAAQSGDRGASQYGSGSPYNGRSAQSQSGSANGYAVPNPYQGDEYNAYSPRVSPSSGDAAGGISYEPAKNRIRKDKKSPGIRAIALICAACVLLSGLCGFGGTLLANRISGGNASGSGTASSSASSAAQGRTGDSVVIYKSADEVTTSTAATAGDDLTYAQVAAIVKDSVVEINTEYTTRNSWFQYTTGGAGSGVVISDDGYVITNAHVILDEEMRNVADTVTVRLTNGQEYAAEVRVYDSDEDIAIIKINATGLTPARCGDSSRLVVGEELVIVGNPLGELGGSVSNGIVSATEREIQVGGVTMHLIQTNAAVNPGNSGGGMFNMKGELVGIVNAKSSGTGIEGLGFAIPINQALAVSEQLLTYGYVRGRPMIGVSFNDVSGSNYFFYYNVKAGVYVSGLVEGMNDKVLKEGDRVIAVNGEEITSSEDIKAIVYASAIGDKLTFQLYRDNKLMEVEVTCYERTPDVQDSSISFGSEEIPGSLDDFFGGR